MGTPVGIYATNAFASVASSGVAVSLYGGRLDYSVDAGAKRLTSAITARTAGTSFQITFNGSIVTNGVCGSYLIIN